MLLSNHILITKILFIIPTFNVFQPTESTVMIRFFKPKEIIHLVAQPLVHYAENMLENFMSQVANWNDVANRYAAAGGK
jgi:hypothetical protein